MRLLFAICCLCPWTALAANQVALHELGERFAPPKDAVIEWKATVRLPSKVTIYKTESNRFSPAVVSNVMALGHWFMQQRSDVPGRPRNPDKDFLHFQNEDGVGYLTVYPRHGLIDYLNEQARTAMGARTQNMPDEKEIVRLGRDFLKRLEIDERDLAKKADGNLRTYGGQRVRGQRGIEQIISRDVYFVRQADGIPFNGIGNYGGVSLTFGDHGKVAELLLVWPALKPIQSLPVALPTDFINYVKQGTAVIVPGETAAFVTSDVQKIIKITVNDIAPFYLGGGTHDPKKIIAPFAVLEITAHMPKTNFAATLCCPLVRGGD